MEKTEVVTGAQGAMAELGVAFAWGSWYRTPIPCLIPFQAHTLQQDVLKKPVPLEASRPQRDRVLKNGSGGLKLYFPFIH